MNDCVIMGDVKPRFVGTTCWRIKDYHNGTSLVRLLDGTETNVDNSNILLFDDLDKKNINDLVAGEEFVSLVSHNNIFNFYSHRGDGVVVEFDNMPQDVKSHFKYIKTYHYTWVKLYNEEMCKGFASESSYNGYKDSYTAYLRKHTPITQVETDGIYCVCNSPVLVRNHALGEWFNVCKICGKERK